MNKNQILNQINSHLGHNKESNKSSLLKKKILDEKLKAKLEALRNSTATTSSSSAPTSKVSATIVTEKRESDEKSRDTKRKSGIQLKDYDCFFTITEPRIPFIPSVLNDKVMICKSN